MNATHPGPEFPRTRWTVVLQLRENPGNPEGTRALEELCKMYWYPLYAYARRCGQAAEDAEDLVQGFFGRLVERDLFARADSGRGRLRSFLLGAFKNYMSEEWRQASRQKRGGGQVLIPIHSLPLEDLRECTGSENSTLNAESLFDRVWFDLLLENALKDLEAEYAARGKGDLFRKLQDFLAWNRKEGKLAEVAATLQMSPGAVRVTILRMRQRFRELIERQISQTVRSPEEASEELAQLRRVLGA